MKSEEGVYTDSNINHHTPKSYWVIGCCGPFGIVDKNLLGKITFPLLKVDDRIKPKQNDNFNCGVIWCLFIHDMMQQASVPYTFSLDRHWTLLPINIGIGKLGHTPLFLDNM